MDDSIEARLAAQHTWKVNKAMQTLMGIVSGILADNYLADLEIHFLKTWLREHDGIAEQWPGQAIYRLVRQVLEDGIVTEDERAHLMGELQRLVNTDFTNTGAALPEGPYLPVDDDVTVLLTNATVCHTGEFLFGTRAAVERATLRAGGMPTDTVSRRTSLLVIGTRTSPHWIGTTYGRKIQRAIELRDGGEVIEIISERRWLAALDSPA